VTWDRDTGQVRTSDLFKLPTDIGVGGRIDVDSTGNNFIMATGPKEEDSLPTLRRWARGQRAHTVLDASADSPVWVP
jgi:hypothetical protein